jgi:hypothetical protein
LKRRCILKAEISAHFNGVLGIVDNGANGDERKTLVTSSASFTSNGATD